jgi:hypothetical protein
VKKAVEHEAALERKTAKKARSTAKHLKPENTKKQSDDKKQDCKDNTGLGVAKFLEKL